MRTQKDPGGPRRTQEDPRAPRRTQENPGELTRIQEDPGASRRTKEDPGHQSPDCPFRRPPFNSHDNFYSREILANFAR